MSVDYAFDGVALDSAGLLFTCVVRAWMMINPPITRSQSIGGDLTMLNGMGDSVQWGVHLRSYQYRITLKQPKSAPWMLLRINKTMQKTIKKSTRITVKYSLND